MRLKADTKRLPAVSTRHRPEFVGLLRGIRGTPHQSGRADTLHSAMRGPPDRGYPHAWTFLRAGTAPAASPNQHLGGWEGIWTQGVWPPAHSAACWGGTRCHRSASKPKVRRQGLQWHPKCLAESEPCTGRGHLAPSEGGHSAQQPGACTAVWGWGGDNERPLQLICWFKSSAGEKEEEGAVQKAAEKYLNISVSSVTWVIWNGKFPLLNKSSTLI